MLSFPSSWSFLLCLSFGPKINPEAFFNNQGKDDYEMGKKPPYRSG
jgi:hypothetical protein